MIVTLIVFVSALLGLYINITTIVLLVGLFWLIGLLRLADLLILVC